MIPGVNGAPDRVIEGPAKPLEFGAPDLYEVDGTQRLLRPRSDGRMVDVETGEVVAGRLTKLDARTLDARLAATTDPAEQQRILRLMGLQANATRGPEALVSIADATSPTGVRFVPRSQAVNKPAPRTERQPTQGQFAAANFVNRMEQAERIFAKLDSAQVARSVTSQLWNEGINDTALARLQSDDYKSWAQAARSFINAVLRRESGAVISAQEFKDALAQYLVKPDDPPALQQQKRVTRQSVISNFRREAAEAYRPLIEIPEVGTEQ